MDSASIVGGASLNQTEFVVSPVYARHVSRLDGEEASDYSEQVSSCDPTTKET
jgi:hypothetical protein